MNYGQKKKIISGLSITISQDTSTASKPEKYRKTQWLDFKTINTLFPPNYIGKEVEIKPAADGKSIRIFYQGSEIKKHDLTNKQFNYDPRDKHAILKSDLMEDKTDEEIDQYMLNNLSIYDQIGE